MRLIAPMQPATSATNIKSWLHWLHGCSDEGLQSRCNWLHWLHPIALVAPDWQTSTPWKYPNDLLAARFKGDSSHDGVLGAAQQKVFSLSHWSIDES